MKELDKLQKQLQDLQAAIDRELSEYGQGKYQELAQEFLKIQSELNLITQEQEKVTNQTGSIRDRLVEELKKQNQGKLKKLFARLRKKLKRAEDKLAGIAEKELDRYQQQSRTESLERSSMLDQALKALDLDNSLKSAQKLKSSLAGLVYSLKTAAMVERRYDPERGKRLDAHKKSSESAHNEVEDILRELEKLMPDPERLLGKGDLKRLEQLSKRQTELMGKLKGLKSQMQKLNESAPLIGGEVTGRLDRCAGHMGRASSGLGQRRPRAAHPHQQAALSELKSLQQAMEKSCKGGKGMPLPMGSAGYGERMDTGASGGRFDRRDVEIPGPDEYQPPEAFRKELLEGMKDPVPEDFKQQVKRYYEELVK
jgi:hypothetical protein